MFGSRSPRLSAPPLSFSVNSVRSTLEFSPKLKTKLYPSPTTQLVPSFSTPRKDFAHTKPHKPLSLRALLRDSLSARGPAIYRDPAALPFRHTPINHLEAALTNPPAKADSKPLTQNLNPLDATLTKIAGLAYLAPARLTTSLLSLPLIPLHYAFEAHHDS
jgi:hypothetical protein